MTPDHSQKPITQPIDTHVTILTACRHPARHRGRLDKAKAEYCLDHLEGGDFGREK